MKLRARLAVTLLLASLPIVLGLSLIGLSARRRALLESTYEQTVQRMEASGRQRCEEAPDRFGRRRGRGRGLGRPGEGPPRGPRRARRWGPRRGRRIARADRQRHVYDDSLQPTSAGSPPLDPELRGAMERGEPVAALWLREPSRARVAMRMPWDGPCAVVVLERPTGPPLAWPGFARALGWSSLVAGLTALAALLAIGPVVRRIRALTASVRAQASEGYVADVQVRGRDEVAELARAFNEAGAEIRTRLQELSSRDEALTKFLSSTTHDVMVPLTVLQGHLSDLSRAARTGREIDPAMVQSALEEAHYLGALVRNLSAAARLDAGEPMLSRHGFDLGELVERVMSRHRPIAKQREISLDHAIPEEPVMILADSTLTEQAISNLVSNAVRYNRAGGHVAVVLETSDGQFRVKVMDDGPGIPAEELARVHERRFRGGAARKRRPTGLGLGLHIVRDVCDKHAWRLEFDSPPEGGLTVHIRGPLAEQRAA